ncbi:MAG TPA: FAD-dependent oxidoreductase [Chitinophagaceae bacterium]|jgi:D-amino-acid oxidase|nr:FAD-dependent oxidoreductase [Chitinophagaceae bacterium]
MAKNIVVVGAGISGLSTAYELLQAGHRVTVMAKEFSPNITSNKAAAFWFPYHIRNDQRGRDWCKKSYSFFKEKSTDSLTGIGMISIIKASKKGVEDETSWLDYMPETSFNKLEEAALPNGYDKGYKATVPLIETQIFLPWLMNQIKEKGANIVQQEITDLQELEDNFDVVVNCSALGARQLCNDATVIPFRGQVVLLEPGLPNYIFLDNQTPSYIVPRKDATIVGGTYEEGVYDAITEEQSLQEILQKAYTILPALKQRKVIGSWAGLRPFRNLVRLEKEGNIIHNYGHGGSGFTLSFGCAKQILQILQNEF